LRRGGAPAKEAQGGTSVVTLRSGRQCLGGGIEGPPGRRTGVGDGAGPAFCFSAEKSTYYAPCAEVRCRVVQWQVWRVVQLRAFCASVLPALSH